MSKETKWHPKCGERVTICDRWDDSQPVATSKVDRFTPSGRMVLTNGGQYVEKSYGWVPFGKTQRGRIRAYADADGAIIAALVTKRQEAAERRSLVARVTYLRDHDVENVPTEALRAFAEAVAAAKVSA